MHVLIVPSYYPNTYSPTDGIYFKVQAEALADYGHQVGVIAPVIIKHYVLLREKKFDYGLKRPKHPIPTFIYQLPSFPVFKWMNDWMRLYFGKKLFKQYIDKYGLPEIIHLHSFENGIIARWIKNKYQIPYVFTEHSTRFARNEYSPRVLSLARKAFNASESLIVVSDDLQEVLKEQFEVNPIIIPNLINTDKFKPLTNEKAYDFISIGGLRDVKNYKMLIHAIPKLEGSPSLIIIGVGPLRDNLQDQIESLDLTGQVQLVGAKSQEEIIALLNQSKVFVSSSRIETFGVAIIEAMSCGLPVVATKSGGPEHFLTSPDFGELCNNDLVSLTDAMKLALTKKYDSEQIRQHIVDNFSGGVVAKQITNQYKLAIQSFSK